MAGSSASPFPRRLRPRLLPACPATSLSWRPSSASAGLSLAPENRAPSGRPSLDCRTRSPLPGAAVRPRNHRKFRRKAGRTLPGASTTASRTIAFCWLPPGSPSMRCSRCFRPRPRSSRSMGCSRTPRPSTSIFASSRAFSRKVRSRSSATRSSASPPRARARSGLTFVGTLALSLWGANAGTKSIFDALNIIYKEREKRSFIS